MPKITKKKLEKTHPMLTSPKSPTKNPLKKWEGQQGDLVGSFEADLLDTLGLADLDELPSDPIEVASVGWGESQVDLGSR